MAFTSLKGRKSGAWLLTLALSAQVALTGSMFMNNETQAQQLTVPAGAALKTLNPAHPRVFMTSADFDRVATQIKTDPQMAETYKRLQALAVPMFKLPPVRFDLSKGDLLWTSRDALNKISLLAGLYRLDKDPRKLARAKQEMLAVAAFPNWNPAHFLDTAEMDTALAIGYDWLYNELNPAERLIFEKALIDKGVGYALSKMDTKEGWWYRVNHNWGLVANGGMMAGALAIADKYPNIAGPYIEKSVKSIQLPMAEYHDDGGWREGPTYWGYGTQYNIFQLAGMKTALGTDFGLSSMPGITNTGAYRMYLTSPMLLQFNFGDAWEIPDPAPQMFWLANNYKKPEYQDFELGMLTDRNYRGLNIFHLLWYNPALGKNSAELDKNKIFPSVGVVSFRSGWNDRNAMHLAIKGGDNSDGGHGHLDMGSFVLESDGVRWAVDQGAGDYSLPDYFGAKRYTYMPTRTEAHNTLTINGNNQVPTSKAPIVDYNTKETWMATTTINLAEAYLPDLRAVYRSAGIVNGKFVIKDDIYPINPSNVIWQMHTKADIALTGNHAFLTTDGKTLGADIISPVGATFSINKCGNVAPLVQNPKARTKINKLMVCLPGLKDHIVLRVEMVPKVLK